jgi:hypothetical protein
MLKSKFYLSTIVAAIALLTSVSVQSAIPSTTGWYQLANTKIQSVCAAANGFIQVAGSTSCNAVTIAWNSAVFDTKRNRLVVWGGGHNDYYGNEIYAINLDSETVERLTDPGLPIATSCTESIVGGTQPNSRHTYDGIEYLPNLDKMFVFGGSLACSSGNFGQDTWLFDFTTKTWQKKNPTGTLPRAIPGILSAYDKVSGLVYLYDDGHLYSYDPVADVYTQLGALNGMGYHLTATIDSKRRLFLIVGNDNVAGGGRVWSISIASGSNYAVQEMVTTGGSTILSSEYPGAEYDAVSDRLVAWSESAPNSVYSLNLDTRVWSVATFSGGPTPVGNGTMGRWRYSPSSGVFVVENKVTDNAFVVRLGAATVTADTTAPSVPTALTTTVQSATQLSLGWTASTDDTAVTAYRIFRCTGSVCTPATLLATATGTSYQDSGLTASTVYRYAVSAIDAAGNASALSTAGSGTTSASSGGGGTGVTPSSDQDYATRCAAAGVIKCVGFDNTTTDIVRGVNLWPDGNGTYNGGLDSSMKTSGGGSLRFDLPPPPHAAPNISGRWSNDVTPLFGQVFSEGSTFYVQFRQRLSPEMVVDSWNNSTWKNVIFHYNTRSCGQIELTTSNYWGAPLAQMDTDCGGRGMWTNTAGTAWTSTPPMLMQQGDWASTCSYGSNYSTSCYTYTANEWLTLYYRITIGTWDQPNSTVEAFVAREGSTVYKQFIKMNNFILHCNGTCTTLPDKAEGYNNLTFTPYMTAVTANDGPSTTAHMWIDELIISTRPIAVPNGSMQVPLPPTGLQVN